MKKKILIIVIAVVGVIFCIACWLWGENINLIVGGSFSPMGTTKIKSNTVSLALGDILLFKTQSGDCGAIRFDKMTKDWGVDYTVWFIPDKSINLPTPSKGHVFEKYWRTRTGISSHFVMNIGGDYQIECGPYTIDWSASTWLYIPNGDTFAIAKKISIQSFDSQKLKWHISNNNRNEAQQF